MMTTKDQKRTAVSFRIRPDLPDKIREAAAAENRSITNWVETAILERLERIKDGRSNA